MAYELDSGVLSQIAKGVEPFDWSSAIDSGINLANKAIDRKQQQEQYDATLEQQQLEHDRAVEVQERNWEQKLKEWSNTLKTDQEKHQLSLDKHQLEQKKQAWEENLETNPANLKEMAETKKKYAETSKIYQDTQSYIQQASIAEQNKADANWYVGVVAEASKMAGGMDGDGGTFTLEQIASRGIVSPFLQDKAEELASTSVDDRSTVALAALVSHMQTMGSNSPQLDEKLRTWLKNSKLGGAINDNTIITSAYADGQNGIEDGTLQIKIQQIGPNGTYVPIGADGEDSMTYTLQLAEEWDKLDKDRWKNITSSQVKNKKQIQEQYESTRTAAQYIQSQEDAAHTSKYKTKTDWSRSESTYVEGLLDMHVSHYQKTTQSPDGQTTVTEMDPSKASLMAINRQSALIANAIFREMDRNSNVTESAHMDALSKYVYEGGETAASRVNMSPAEWLYATRNGHPITSETKRMYDSGKTTMPPNAKAKTALATAIATNDKVSITNFKNHFGVDAFNKAKKELEL